MPIQKDASRRQSSPGEPARRAYHSPARRRQAEENRRRILAAGRALFSRLGYAGTTVEAIADEAGVSSKTVVAVFGSKRGILAEVVNPIALDSPVQEELARLRTETDPARRVALVAALVRQVYAHFAAEFELLRGAGVVAPELADIANTIEERRHSQEERLITFLQEHSALRPDLAPDAAADELWALTSFDLYRALVVQRAWAPERYEAWLTAMLIQHLLSA